MVLKEQSGKRYCMNVTHSLVTMEMVVTAAGDAWRAAVVRFATTGDPGVENGWGKKLGRDGQGERTIIGSGGKLRAEEFSTIL